jgi:hypothetical protein
LTLPLKSLLPAFGEINPDSRHWKGRENAILVLVAVFAQKTFGKQQRWLGNVLMECKNFENSGISNLWTTSRDCPEFSKQHSRN